MASLYHTLNVGSQALFATRQGVDTAGHNIANAQTEGYSRQRVNLRSRYPLEKHGIVIGNGVYINGIRRAHDQFVEKQLNIANQDRGRQLALYDGLKSLEIIYSPELEASVSDQMTNFFNSLQDMANFPEDFTTRTNVVETAKDLVTAIHKVDSDLKENRQAFNERIKQSTAKLSESLQAVAKLNVQIQVVEGGQEKLKANDLRDQRDELLRQITGEIEVTYYEDQFGMLLIRGPKQVTLVDGGNAAKVDVAANQKSAGFYDIVVTDWEENRQVDVTHDIEGGRLESLVKLRDEVVPDLLAKNNEMAYVLTKEFNNIHRQGFGLNEYSEKTGRDFFRNVEDLNNAALEFGVDDGILHTTDAIGSASTPLAPGDNVNLNNLIKLKEARLLENGNVTFNEYYSNYVGSLGLEVVRAEQLSEASDIVTSDLRDRRESISGVSLDEEAMNLLKWQSNFTASSKVITTVDEMLETVLSIKR